MNSIVFYGTRTGNTRRVAEAIADGLRAGGHAEARPVEEGTSAIAGEIDLVIVGGPTEGHGMTPQLERFLDSMPDGLLAGRQAAAFDTRVNWPRFLSGSAAEGIRARLERAGARPIVRSESFIVSMKPEIGTQELERARAWGASFLPERVTAGAGS